MEKVRSTLVLFSISALSITGLTACSSGSSDVADDCEPQYEFTTLTEGKLTISTYDGMPYYGTNGGERQGIDVDFLDAFAADSCLEPDWVVSPSASVIQSVISGRADIAAGGWYATEERGQSVDQTNASYVELPTVFSKDGAESLDQLRGKTVGTVTGYLWVDELKRAGVTVAEFQTADAPLNDLAADRIDYAVLGGIDAPYMLTQNASYKGIEAKTMAPTPEIDSTVNPSLPNYPHTKGNTELTEALNTALAQYRDKGELAASLESYGLSADLADVDR